MPTLRPLLAPRSIAVVGGAPALRVVEQSLKLGFAGPIWPVHPTRAQMAGLECFPSIRDLPAAPDAVFVGVNRRATIDTMRELAAMGAAGAVCYGSGFAESGEESLQEELLDVAGTIPFLGPNCYGLLNSFDRVALWPDEHGLVPLERGVAIVSQSGNVGLNLTFQRRGLRLGAMITVGNQASVGTEDVVDALLDDERVTSIGLFIEAFKDPVRFGEVALRAAERDVPIVTLQTGRSSTGAKIAASHTGAMAGRAAAYDALFARYGIAAVRTPAELIETLKILDLGGPLSGRRIVSMSCSGGEASLVADRCESTALVVDPFDDDHRRRIESTLDDDRVSVSNPFDYHTFMWGDREAMGRCFTAVMEGDQDVTMLVLDAPTDPANDVSSWLPAIDALADASQRTDGRAVVVSTLSECLDERLRGRVEQRGLTALLGLSEALAALDAAATCKVQHRPLHAAAAEFGKTRSLDEAEAKQRLRRMGLPVPEGQVASRDELVEVAETIGYPVTLKALGHAHKSEVGGVVVGLRDASAVLDALDSMPSDTRAFLVEATVTDVVAEVLVAVRRDPPIGWVVTLGFGGVTTELWRDVTHLLAPVDADEVVAALSLLRSAPLLHGFRGRPSADVDALAMLVTALVDAVVGTSAVEVELNPVLVGRSGATIVDALWLEEDLR